jgi:hypothetical protein
MARITEQESQMLKGASHLAEGVGYIFAAKESYSNFKDCEEAH